MAHEVYKAIVEAVKSGTLKEPFNEEDFRKTCQGFGHGTYSSFLYKHVEANPGGKSELFERISPGWFRCLRPFKYGF